MKVRTPALFVLLVAAAAAADDPKAPEGWKYVESKDKTYQVLMPATTARSGTRNSSSNRGGTSMKKQIDYATLADGTTLTATATTLSGTAVKGLKIGDVYKLTFDAVAADGGEVTEPKEFEMAGRKGKEAYHTAKDKTEERLVVLVGKNRTYELLVSSKDKAKLTDETANTFLKSLVLATKDAPPAGKDGEKKPDAK